MSTKINRFNDLFEMNKSLNEMKALVEKSNLLINHLVIYEKDYKKFVKSALDRKQKLDEGLEKHTKMIDNISEICAKQNVNSVEGLLNKAKDLGFSVKEVKDIKLMDKF
jgi:hypothetical protein